MIKRIKIPQLIYQKIILETRGLCCICHLNNIDEIHHIKAIYEGGLNNYENLIGLCSNCHTRIHKYKSFTEKKLFEIKESWKNDCIKYLTEIITAQPDPIFISKFIATEYIRTFNKTEYSKFKTRLNAFLQIGEVYKNLARVNKHLIKRM